MLNGYPDLLEGFNYFLNPNDLTSHMCTGRQEAMRESLENKSEMCDICDVCDKSFTNFDTFKSHICEITEESIVGNLNEEIESPKENLNQSGSGKRTADEKTNEFWTCEYCPDFWTCNLSRLNKHKRTKAHQKKMKVSTFSNIFEVCNNFQEKILNFTKFCYFLG